MTQETGSRIVAGVDGSLPAIAALRAAAELAEALHAPLHVVTISPDPAMAEYFPVENDSLRADAETVQLRTIRDTFGDRAPAHLTREVIPGSPAANLIHLSESSRMIVLGNRGRGGFASLLLGSVSSACVAHATCPVLVVHQPR